VHLTTYGFTQTPALIAPPVVIKRLQFIEERLLNSFRVRTINMRDSLNFPVFWSYRGSKSIEKFVSFRSPFDLHVLGQGSDGYRLKFRPQPTKTSRHYRNARRLTEKVNPEFSIEECYMVGK
jgi:hypothetical protein